MNRTAHTDDPEADPQSKSLGRIITFYSYKGGTGRTQALANIAWILAANGARVLMIDWDLEAPGLHRYFHPFLDDPELARTPGLIDFFVNFAQSSHVASQEPKEVGDWYSDLSDLARYSVPIKYEFGEGFIDFIGAGLQSASYGGRVNSYAWTEFYEALGGGVFLEMVKARLRSDYDYVLIDSRTGLSDTSGICTVQMPDELVVCFTLNRQSVVGSAAVAASADSLRRTPDDRPGLKIWPIATRVDLSEKDRLESARLFARGRFASTLWHVPTRERAAYWGSAEILYFPYYAYEEVLATIADAPHQSTSLVASFERITTFLTSGRIRSMPAFARGERESLLRRYEPRAVSPGAQRRFFLSYAVADKSRRIVARVAEALQTRFGKGSVYWEQVVPLGFDIGESLRRALEASDTLLVFIGKHYDENRYSKVEVTRALALGKTIIPVLVDGADATDLPKQLQSRRTADLSPDSFESDLAQLLNELGRSTPSESDVHLPMDVEDPNRGQFGGLAERDSRRLSAVVTQDPEEEDWFNIEISVTSQDESQTLLGEVEFHLHPTFKPQIRSRRAVAGAATLAVSAWGAFTVGAVADNGLTRLELDLAELPDAPRIFRMR